jgi:hypothetical protein
MGAGRKWNTKRTAIIPALVAYVLVIGVHSTAHATRGNASLTNPQVLALPASAWPPNTVMEDSRAIDAAAADSGLLLLSAIVARSQTYASAGMTTGYFQRYAHRDSSAGDVLAYWMATLYGTSSQADTMVELGKQAIDRHATPAVDQVCPAGLPGNCAMFVTTSIGSTVRVGYAVWSADNVMAEVALVAYAGTPAFPLDVFTTDLNTLAEGANTATDAALYPIAPTTDIPVPTMTPVPVRSTAVVTSTRTSTPTATIVTPPSPTVSATAVPLFVTVRVRSHSVVAGAYQAIRVTTLARATLTIVVTFPDGSAKRHHGAAGLLGHAVWSFRQPPRHTTASRRTARVVVTARGGAGSSAVARAQYSIR